MSVQAELHFSKQFLISPGDLPGFCDLPHMAGWKQQKLAGGQTLYHHPKLAVSQATDDKSEIICLGDLLDPDRPEADNEAVIHALAREVSDFESLEARLARMGGRWLIIARFGDAMFLYHDACGLKTVFLYTDSERCRSYVASQPALFDHVFSLRRVEQRDQEVRQLGVPQWPPYVYPYDNVVQLLPNHRVNLVDYAIERYWPKGDIASVSMDEAASTILTHVGRIVEAAVNRRQCHISLTGGYDSRLLLACSLSHKEHIKYFTFTHPALPRHDRIIPRKLAHQCRLAYRPIELKPADARLMDVLHENSSHMCFEPSLRNTNTLAELLDGGFFLQGTVGEQLRCLYYKDGRRPVTTLDELCRRTRFERSALGRQGLAKWLESSPQTNLEPLEILYWELTSGIWLSSCSAFKEAVVEIIPPMNCRHVLETGLGVDVAYRARPHQLFRRVYELADNRLLKFDLNTTWRAEFVANAKKSIPLPWRVKRALGFF